MNPATSVSYTHLDVYKRQTHFFQNLTSFGVGYFTINAYMKDGIYNQEVLDTRPAIEETRFIRHVRFDKPLIVKMDGKKKLGVVMLPE